MTATIVSLLTVTETSYKLSNLTKIATQYYKHKHSLEYL